MTLNEQITQTYLSYHTPKEEAFWESYMGLSSYVEGTLEQKEEEYLDFVNDPQWLDKIREALNHNLEDSERFVLEGWKKFFQVNRIDHPRALAITKELLPMVERLLKVRKNYKAQFVNPRTGREESYPVSKLLVLVKTDPSEEVRKASWEALRALEHQYYEAGFLEVVKKRNQMARLLGYSDYYDYKSQMYEGMSKDQIFHYLDSLKEAAIKHLSPRTAWNMAYENMGELNNLIDPFVPLETSLDVWGQSFSRMGYGFAGAQINIDLIARDEKYSNGFMHAPLPPYVGPKGWVPARINFTANALPGQAGSGLKAIETLFHEGGHAAHFANVRQKAPVFSQEFPPTSAALAESQSMFADSFITDPNWLRVYGKTLEGVSITEEQIAKIQKEKIRTLPVAMLSLMTICYAEKALYEIPEDKLSPDYVHRVIEEAEREMFGGELCFRPTFAVPHLLTADASCTYHGYVLAEIAVHQQRHYFYENLPYVVDNPAVGERLRDKLWFWGSSKGFEQLIEAVTEEPLSSQYIIDNINGKATPHRDSQRTEASVLEGNITLCHGDEVISSSTQGNGQKLSKDFSEWLKKY
ncbi:M3 family metallopeptidase [Spirochaeta cellobiosiphila]|uniref:M3 family metallopeptidase n=1 Tax=Spirochaeta cellobiosiphila TaxID=504483 RepID=UPI000419BFC2|nr:M3 family metallopeptidase [Spirochaeta cellobiosiphila]